MGCLKYGVVSAPIMGAAESGDAFCVIEGDERTLVAVADGLGHGEQAAEASRLAMDYIRAHANETPQALVAGCHRVLSRTRGAVLAVVRIDRVRRCLEHAGLGNIETRIVGVEKTYRPVTVNGIAGHSARKFRCEDFPFHPGDLLIMHSDGISDRFDLSPAARGRDLQMLADQIAREHGRHHDDQLLLIARDT